MKYIVILCDGMADEPLESLSGKTPLEAAKTLTFSVRSFEYRRADGGLGCVFSVQPCYIDRG